MPISVRFEYEPAKPLAVVKRRASSSQLKRIVPEACGTAWDLIKKAGLSNPGRLVAVYLDAEMNLEVGAEVDGEFDAFGDLYASQTPPGMVATATHIGAYDRLGDAHQAVNDACKAQGRRLAGPSWEIYGHWTDDPMKLRTDVYYLLQDDLVESSAR